MHVIALLFATLAALLLTVFRTFWQFDGPTAWSAVYLASAFVVWLLLKVAKLIPWGMRSIRETDARSG